MEIVRAQVRHIPGMLRLLGQVGQVHHDIRPDLFRSGAQKYDEGALAELLKDPLRPIFVAVEETMLGYCFCIYQQHINNNNLTDIRTLYIDDLCVDENRRGGGIATALYRHATDYAKRLGCAFVSLNVWCGNENAMAFYEKMGLKPQKIGMESILEQC